MNSSCFICTRQLSPKGFNSESISKYSKIYRILIKIISLITAYATWCGHVYHRQCIAPYVDEKKHCPYCKRYCSVAQLIRLQWKLIDDDDEITIMAENKISNELMMENVAMLTNQMNDKDSRMSEFE